MSDRTFTVGKHTYTLLMDMNAAADFELVYGKGLVETASDSAKLASPLVLRALLWACLLHQHPQMTLREAGVLAQAGGPAMVQALEDAAAAFAQHMMALYGGKGP